MIYSDQHALLIKIVIYSLNIVYHHLQRPDEIISGLGLNNSNNSKNKNVAARQTDRQVVHIHVHSN